MRALGDRVAALLGRPYLLLSLTTLGWAGNAVAGRLAVGHVSPMLIVALRWLVVILALAVFVGRSTRAEWPLALRHWRYIFAMGALGFTIFNAIFYWSAHYTSAINIGLIQGVMPALVMAMAFLAYGLRVTPLQAVGVIVTLGGVLVVASHGSLETLRHFAFNIGDVGIFLATFLYSGYTVALRQRPALSPLAFFTAMACAAFLTTLPFLAVELARGEVLWPDPAGWAIVLYIGLVPSLLCQIAYIRAVQSIGPNRAGLFMNLVPVLAAILGVAILGESFGLHHAVGLTLVLGGIWLAERRPSVT